MEATKSTFEERLYAHYKSGSFGDIKVVREPKALFSNTGSSRILYAGSFNGEKNLGEMGPIKNYMMDYAGLSLRSWQAYIESAEAQAIINKYCTWVIGRGLKLQAEPVKRLILKKNDLLKYFSEEVEARWQVYANSKTADHTKRSTLNQLSFIAYKNAKLGGDLLTVLRYTKEDTCTVQLIDTAHMDTPVRGSEFFPMITASGNRCINGVEINSKGEHVAYYIKKPFNANNPLAGYETERIPAKLRKNGLVVAFLVYGSKYRIDNERGIPLLTSALEKLKKMERYEEATLASAEEQNKINFQVVHEPNSTGEFPFAKSVARARDASGMSDLPTDDNGNQLADRVYATTNKQTINNPIGAEIKPLKTNESTLYFSDFIGKCSDIVCSMLGIPPNVAMSKYDSNYSASRAAIKDWEHVLLVERKDFAVQFFQPIYDFWLEVEILSNRIQAPGYLIALTSNDQMTLEAYRTTRWVGAPVANIDPVKEVEAERLKLGITAESIPLTTVEAATEILNGGDSDHNMEQYSFELEMSKALGLKPEPEVKQQAIVTDK
jgi:capsid protein